MLAGTFKVADRWDGMCKPRPIRLGSFCFALAMATALFVVGDMQMPTAMAEGSSVGRGEGGYVPDFVAIVRQYNASGEPFRIAGACKSACTLFLGIRNVCVERNATLMFHAGHDIAENVTGPNTRASRAALYRYNEALRRYLLDEHHMETEAFHSLSGSTIIDRFGYRECSPKQ
jgi:hypothetical protein